MKLKITFLILICFAKIYSQKIEKEIGDIKITTEGYYFEDYLKSKKRKIDKSEFYFDKLGKILEKISFGRHHYNRLTVIGDFTAGYIINPSSNLKIFANEIHRSFDPTKTSATFEKYNTTWLSIGISADLFNWYFDY